STVVDEDPAHRHQAMAGLVPVRPSADHFHVPGRAAVPPHAQALARGVCHHLLGRGLLVPFGARSPDSRWGAPGWGWPVEIGGGVEATDERKVATITVG